MNINYEVPDELHRRLKVAAAERGMTLKALIIELLESALDAALGLDSEDT